MKTSSKLFGGSHILHLSSPEDKKEILDSIIASYEKFFFDLNTYNYEHFKEKADLMALN